MPDEEKIAEELISREENIVREMYEECEKLLNASRTFTNLYGLLNISQKLMMQEHTNFSNHDKDILWKQIEEVMQTKDELQGVANRLVPRIIEFKTELDFGNKLRDLINDDEYLKAEWNKIVFYIHMKYNKNDEIGSKSN